MQQPTLQRGSSTLSQTASTSSTVSTLRAELPTTQGQASVHDVHQQEPRMDNASTLNTNSLRSSDEEPRDSETATLQASSTLTDNGSQLRTKQPFNRAYSDDQLRFSRERPVQQQNQRPTPLPPSKDPSRAGLPDVSHHPNHSTAGALQDPLRDETQRHSIAGESISRNGHIYSPPEPLLHSQEHSVSSSEKPSHLSSDLEGLRGDSQVPIYGVSSAFSRGIDLPPPGYHTHNFPPTPPALELSSRDSPFVASFDQHLALTEDPPLFAQPPFPNDAPQPPAAGFGARFPRWRGWLEKRALERHYARMDAAAAAGTPLVDSHGNPLPAPPSRKKSWGAWINDPDALSDDDVSLQGEQEHDAVDPSKLPPLHVHHYGSRFIPHLNSQPLCSVLIELPPASPSATLNLRLASADPRSRQILLIGTSEGLFAFQRRRSSKSKSQRPENQNEPSSSASGSNGRWNEDVRCIPIWSGLGVYQMCILASKDPPTSSSPFGNSRADRHTSGIFLALTCPSTARNGAITSTLMQLSAQAGAILESVASTNHPSAASSNGHGANFFHADSSEGVAAANFGSAAGGGPGRAVPPGGGGTVRMWNLEAIRKILLYALDNESAHLPLDLVGEKTASKEKMGKLGAILKKTFAKERVLKPKQTRANRKQMSDGMGGKIDPLPIADDPGSPKQGALTPGDHPSEDGFNFNRSSDNLSSSRRSSFQSGSQHGSRMSFDSLSRTVSREGAEPHINVTQDPALDTVMALALSSIPIRAPSQHPNGSSHTNPSFSSLFADDLYQPFSGKQGQAKGKERDGGASSSSKGVHFFSVHEAAADTKATGTWYLALATARSVMIYEASPPKRGASRSWSWVNEFYAPFPVKAIAFAPASVSDTLQAIPSPTSLTSVSGSTKLKVSSVEAPLSASRRSIPSSPTTGKNKSAGILRPYHPLGGAAPTSWHRADLCVFLSFGRRAVVVRLSDSNVREFELKPLAEVTYSLSPTTTNMPSHLSLQPKSLTAAGEPLHSAGGERSRPQSIVGLNALSHHSSVNSSSLGHSRTGSVEQKIKDAILDKRSNKHNWVGFSNIQAQIRIRQHKTFESEASDPAVLSPGSESATSRPMPSGHSLLKSSSIASSILSSNVDKDLPKTPAPQNASFDRRASRLNMDPESLRAYEAVQAESSSGSEDDNASASVNSGRQLRKYALTDRGYQPQVRQGGGRFGRFRPKKQSSADFFEGTELVAVRLALVSRGSVTHVLPLPLPADLARPTPLGVLQWSDTPNSVSGWARVLGVERARSTGAMSTDHFKETSGTSSPVQTIQLSPPSLIRNRPALSSQPSSGKSPHIPRKKSNRLGVHVSVTCVAFLASRIEVKKVTFKVPVEVDFEVSRYSELELVPPIPPSTYEGKSDASQTNERRYSRSRNSIFHSSTVHTTINASGVRNRGSTSSLISSVAHSGAVPADPEAHDDIESSEDPDSHSQELEYLCGSMLTLNPIDLDLTSSGSQSLVLPLHPDEASSLSPQLFSELGGDGGVVAFDWRGAHDFRIFSVGARG